MGYADWMYIDRYISNPGYTDNNLPRIRVGHVARSMHMSRTPITELPNLGCTDWKLVTGRIQLSREPTLTMEDFSVFAKLQPKEILIPQADMSVVEQLEAIIKAQEPKQHELRQLILDKPRTMRSIASITEVA
jgi:hypothetical protein